MKRSYIIAPGSENSKDMFYSGNKQEHRCIAHLRGDFGKAGDEFWTSFWPHEGVKGAGDEYKAEINALVKALRKDLLKNRISMRQYIRQHPPLILESREIMVYGYRTVTEEYEYYIRCSPCPGCYDFYIYCYLCNVKRDG